MKSLHTIVITSALLLNFGICQADEAFSSAESFKNPVKMSASVTTYLVNELGSKKMSACQASKPSDIFEAQEIELNKSVKALLVKPAHMCLCEDNNCPMWVFKTKGNITKPVWSSAATKNLEVLDKKLNGYRKLKEASTDETHGRESTWSWNRDNYVEIHKHVWIWDTEKHCRSGEETTQMMDGQMIEKTKQCGQN